MADVQAVVHMGGISVEGPFAPILQANVVGVYNLYEAARKNGTKRVAFASSNHVTGFYKQSETIAAERPPRPDGYYGLSKAFGEDISRMYFDRYCIETACVRIGSSLPEPRDRRMLATWLSYDDLHRLITACLTTPVLAHTIIFGMSNNSVTWWDNAQARHVGYVPKDKTTALVQRRRVAEVGLGCTAIYLVSENIRTVPMGRCLPAELHESHGKHQTRRAGHVDAGHPCRQQTLRAHCRCAR